MSPTRAGSGELADQDTVSVAQDWVPVTAEPVRGSIFPSAGFALHGLEHVQAMIRGVAPRPPLFRLMGIHVSAAGPGTATLTQRASPWLQGRTGAIWLHPLIDQAIRMAVRTGFPSGRWLLQPQVSASYFRGVGLENEAFIARASVIASGRSAAMAVVDVEDTFGRKLAHGASRCFMVDAPDLPTSAQFDPGNEPTFASPDPPDRPLDASVEVVGLQGARETLGSQHRPAPVQRLLGWRLLDRDGGRVVWSMPATEWLSTTPRIVDPAVVSHFMLYAATTAAYSAVDASLNTPIHTFHANFIRPGAPPDGRDLIARAHVVHEDGEQLLLAVETINADGQRIGVAQATASVLPDAAQGDEIGPERALHTVLFTDIVSSTQRLAEVGDAKWADLYQRHIELVRRQLQIFRGREIKTTGDGILATFDSPALAVQCARAINEAARRARFDIRTGIHLGECELLGADVAGIAVVVARRVCDTGSAGEILVTSTVREASAGSGLRFADRGMHQLKGVPDQWRLFGVES